MSLVAAVHDTELAEAIMAWARIHSPTFDKAGVDRMMDLAAAEAARLGLAVERKPGEVYGDTVIARLAGPGGEVEGGILVLGHLDTVHGADSVGRDLAVSIEGDRIYGPGIYDMKGGMRMALHALELIGRLNLKPKLPVTFLFIPDEEIGSPTSRDLIEREALRQRYVLVPEPSHDGRVVTGRHAFQRFVLRTRGRPAHAGVDNRRGKSAIAAMAELIGEIETRSDFDAGETFSVGVVSGGKFVNVIPTACEAEVLCVSPTEASVARVRAAMLGLAGERGQGVTVEVEPGPVRPLFQCGRGTLALFERARAIAAEAGLKLGHGQFGGGSDGNFTGALGIPTLDGLGVDGAGLHTPGEYMIRSTLARRCAILAGLLRDLD